LANQYQVFQLKNKLCYYEIASCQMEGDTSSSFVKKRRPYKYIHEQAKQHGLNVDAPFLFLLEGSFDELALHVINGRNPKLGGHGKRSLL